MKEHYLLTILSEDRKGLVSVITSMLNRRCIDIESISASKTDIQCQVLITIEVLAKLDDVKYISCKINNIIEVNQVDVASMQNARYQKLGLYTIKKDGCNHEIYTKLQKYGATMVSYCDNTITFQKIGRDEDILLVYNILEGPYLLNFTKTPAISLHVFDADLEPVISLAA